MAKIKSAETIYSRPLRKPSGRHLTIIETGTRRCFGTIRRHSKGWLPLYKAIQRILPRKLAKSGELRALPDAKKFPFRVRTLVNHSTGRTSLHRVQWATTRQLNQPKFRRDQFAEPIPEAERKSAAALAKVFTQIRNSLGEAIAKKKVTIEARTVHDRIIPFRDINPEIWQGNSFFGIFETGLISTSHLKSNVTTTPDGGRFFVLFFEPNSVERYLSNFAKQYAQTERWERLSDAEVKWFINHMLGIHSLFEARLQLKGPDWYRVCQQLSLRARDKPLPKKRFEKQIWPEANKRDPATGVPRLSGVGAPSQWRRVGNEIAILYIDQVSSRGVRRGNIRNKIASQAAAKVALIPLQNKVG